MNATPPTGGSPAAPVPRDRHRRSRAAYLLAAGLTLIAGLASRRFSEFLPGFFGKYPGDALWALMVFFGIGAIFPGMRLLRRTVLASGFCGAVELLKFNRASWLVDLRQTTAGHLIFGSVFSWQNLVAYAAGIALGLLLEWLALRRRARLDHTVK